MLSFKTRYTSVELGETVKISRKGKNSLETAYDYNYILKILFGIMMNQERQIFKIGLMKW